MSRCFFFKRQFPWQFEARKSKTKPLHLLGKWAYFSAQILVTGAKLIKSRENRGELVYLIIYGNNLDERVKIFEKSVIYLVNKKVLWGLKIGRIMLLFKSIDIF